MKKLLCLLLLASVGSLSASDSVLTPTNSLEQHLATGSKASLTSEVDSVAHAIAQRATAAAEGHAMQRGASQGKALTEHATANRIKLFFHKWSTFRSNPAANASTLTSITKPFKDAVTRGIDFGRAASQRVIKYVLGQKETADKSGTAAVDSAKRGVIDVLNSGLGFAALNNAATNDYPVLRWLARQVTLNKWGGSSLTYLQDKKLSRRVVRASLDWIPVMGSQADNRPLIGETSWGEEKAKELGRSAGEKVEHAGRRVRGVFDTITGWFSSSKPKKSDTNN